MRRKHVMNLFLTVSILFLAMALPKMIAYSAAKDYEKELSELESYAIFYDENGNRIDTSAKTKINDGKPYVNFYDENGRLINSYSQDQLTKWAIDTDIYKESKESKSEIPTVKFYDENNVRLDPPAHIEKEMMELSEGDRHKLLVFHKTSFLHSIGIGQNRTLMNPKSLIVEPDVEFEAMSVHLMNPRGVKVGRIEIGNFLGAINIPLSDYAENDSYSILLMNGNQGKPIHLVGGIVLFD